MMLCHCYDALVGLVSTSTHGPEHKRNFNAVQQPAAHSLVTRVLKNQTGGPSRALWVVKRAVEVASSEVLGVSSGSRLWIPSIAMQLNAI